MNERVRDELADGDSGRVLVLADVTGGCIGDKRDGCCAPSTRLLLRLSRRSDR